MLTHQSGKDVDGPTTSVDHSHTVKGEKEVSGPIVCGCGRQAGICWDGRKGWAGYIRKSHSETFTNPFPDDRTTQVAAGLPEVSLRSSPLKTHSSFAAEFRERYVQHKEFYRQRFFSYFYKIQTNLRSELKQISSFVYTEYP